MHDIKTVTCVKRFTGYMEKYSYGLMGRRLCNLVERMTASYTIGANSFSGVKRPGRGVNHPPPFSAEVKERVELYLYSPCGPLWHVLV